MEGTGGLAAEFKQYCEAEPDANVFEFLKRHPEASSQARLEVLMADIPRRVLNNPKFRIEEYLKHLPALDSNPDIVFQLLILESEVRQARGEHLDSHEFQQRFPDIWGRLSKLFKGRSGPLSDLGGNAAAGTMQAPAGLPGVAPGTAKPEAGREEEETYDSNSPQQHEFNTNVPVAGGSAQFSGPPPSTVPDVPAGPDPMRVLGQIFQARYRVTSHLGGGGMGSVYAARDLRFDRVGTDAGLVAIKFMKSGMSSQDGFRREANLMRQFRHANFVEVFDYGVTTGGMPWLVMEYLPGSTVEQLLTKHNNRLPQELVVKFIREVCPALQSAHARNLVHRDLKPANIMLAFEDVPDEACFKILDFGLSSQTDANDSLVNASMNMAGTAAFMAPEQVKGEAVTRKADIYSLGIILFRLLTGHAPLPGGSIPIACYHQIHTPPRHFEEVARNLKYPPEVEAVVLQCLEKSPDKRPSSVAEIQERLLAALAPPPVQELPPPSRWRWVLAAVLVIGAPLLALALRPASPAPGKPVFITTGPLKVTPAMHPAEVELAAGRELDVTIDCKDLPPGKDFTVEPRPIKVDGLQVSAARPGKRPGEKIVTIKSLPDRKPQALASVVLTARVRDSGKKILFEKDLSLPVRIVWLPAGFSEAPGATVQNVDGKSFFSQIERPVGTERVTFLLVPELPGCPLKSFYIMQDKLWQSLFLEFLASPEASAIKRKPELLSELGGTEHPRWPATNMTVDEAFACAQWLGGEQHGHLPSGEQWDRASGQEFHARISNTSGRCQPPASWDPQLWMRGPFKEPWDEGNKDGVALNDFRDVGTSPLDLTCYGCRDMAGNGLEFVNDAILVQGKDRVPLSNPNANALDAQIELRGKAVTSSSPRFFDSQWVSMQPFLIPDENVGFRVVINP